jgi:hypothetical protein
MAQRTLATAALGFAVAIAVALASSRSARAADATAQKQACVDAATRGQIQRDDGKLGAAAEAFVVCAESACPPAVRQSCSEWLADVQTRRPTVIIELPPAKAGTGAKLFVDGNARTFATSIALDPGAHVARVEIPTETPFEQPFILAEREKKTLVAERPIPPPSTPLSRDERPIPLSVWLLGGVSVVGIAGFTAFGVMAKSDTDRLRDECAPACSRDARDDAFRTALVADVSLAIGIVAAVSAGVLFVLRPTRTVSAGNVGIAF